LPDENQIYPPREDTFFLLQKALEIVQSRDIVLEVGTGSGIIASSLQGYARVYATDINPHAVGYAHSQGVDVIRTDLVSGLRKVFTLVLFNPPYLPTSTTERSDDWLEYALDGGPDGRHTLSRFLSQVPGVLASGGRIIILISSLQSIPACERLFEHFGFSYEHMQSEMLEDGEELRIYLLTINR